MSDPNNLIGNFKALTSFRNHEEALDLLKKVASSVKPIMKKYGWHVGLLSEFFPDNPSLLGLNINGGAEIRIRLRPAFDGSRFFPFDDLIGTMLHEYDTRKSFIFLLTHIIHGPHDTSFYNLLEKLNADYDELLVNGYTGEGFYSQGTQLGQGFSHNVPPALARQKALEAAENRRRQESIMMGGGRRLGGDNWIGLSMSEKAAFAAEMRRNDSIWCGNEKTFGEGSVFGEKRIELTTSRSPAVQIPEDKIPAMKWACSQCTFLNKPLVLQCELCFAERLSDNIPNISYDSVSHQPSWTCQRCTFVNAGDVVMCLGCDYLREDMVS